MKTFSRYLFCIGSVLLAASGGLATAANLATQVNRDGGVEVIVTPRTLAPNAAAWEFDVMLNTHKGSLVGDPAQFSQLVDSRGRAHTALAWQGDAPGGHHRKGVLRFQPLAGQTAIELRINGVGGVETRRFHWQVP